MSNKLRITTSYSVCMIYGDRVYSGVHILKMLRLNITANCACLLFFLRLPIRQFSIAPPPHLPLRGALTGLQ